MLSFKNLLINENSSILDAIKVIDSNNHRICFVVSSQGKLLGSITDGDIRRGMLKKIELSNNVLKICNKKPFFFKKDGPKKFDLTYDDNCIPIVDKRKKVIDVKIFKPKNNKIVSALIMAGGKGTRLYPITKNIPKPLVKIKGESLIKSLIAKLFSNEIKDIKISIHHMHGKIKKHLKNKKNPISDKNFIIENNPLGTGGSIKLFETKHNNFFIINCDIKLNIEFSKISNFHLNQKADITVVSKQIIKKLSYGKLNIDSKFNVVSIKEKPMIINYVSTGLYIVHKKIKKLIKNNQKIDMDEIIKLAIKKKMKIVSYPLYENWVDVGTRKELRKFTNNKKN